MSTSVYKFGNEQNQFNVFSTRKNSNTVTVDNDGTQVSINYISNSLVMLKTPFSTCSMIDFTLQTSKKSTFVNFGFGPREVLLRKIQTRKCEEIPLCFDGRTLNEKHFLIYKDGTNLIITADGEKIKTVKLAGVSQTDVFFVKFVKGSGIIKLNKPCDDLDGELFGTNDNYSNETRSRNSREAEASYQSKSPRDDDQDMRSRRYADQESTYRSKSQTNERDDDRRYENGDQESPGKSRTNERSQFQRDQESPDRNRSNERSQFQRDQESPDRNRSQTNERSQSQDQPNRSKSRTSERSQSQRNRDQESSKSRRDTDQRSQSHAGNSGYNDQDEFAEKSKHQSRRNTDEDRQTFNQSRPQSYDRPRRSRSADEDEDTADQSARTSYPQQSRLQRFEQSADNDVEQFAGKMLRDGRYVEQKIGRYAREAKKGIQEFAGFAENDARKIFRAGEKDVKYAEHELKKYAIEAENAFMQPASKTLSTDSAYGLRNDENAYQKYKSDNSQENFDNQDDPDLSITLKSFKQLLPPEELSERIEDIQHTCKIYEVPCDEENEECIIKVCRINDAVFMLQIDNNASADLHISDFFLGQVIAIITDARSPGIILEAKEKQCDLVKIDTTVYAVRYGRDEESSAKAIIKKDTQLSVLVKGGHNYKSFCYKVGNKTECLVPTINMSETRYGN